MPLHSLKPKYAIAFTVGLLVLEAVCIAISSHKLMMNVAVAFSFQIFGTALLLVLNFRRISRSIRLKRQWILLTIGSLLGFAALVLRASIYIANLSAYPFPVRVDYTDLLFVFVYIPDVFLLSLPSGKPYTRVFFWIDAVQIVIAGYLCYIMLFSIIPFTHTPAHAIPGGRMVHFHDLVCVTLSCAAVLRFFASATVDERRFYRLIWWSMWSNTILIGIYNFISTQSIYAGYEELLPLTSFLFGALLIIYLPAESEDATPVNIHNPLTTLLNITSPSFFTFSLLALGIHAAQSYFWFGIGAIVAAFLLYGLRATILQRNFERSQLSLQEARDRLESLSLKDGLTGVANRRCFDQILEVEWNRAVRMQQPLSLLLVDVDHFKLLNDKFGHRAGDDCLVQIARAQQLALSRSGDLLARYGGEEFAVILPATDQNGAKMVAENIQEAVKALKIRNETSIGPYVSISVGISTYVFPDLGSPSLLVEASDSALYQAKERGRNRIEFMTIPFFLDRRRLPMPSSLC